MLRVVDSGTRPPRHNLALTEALCRRHGRGLAPPTLRFQHFPPSAIIGRHQILGAEIDLDWCASHGVLTARRMTGGGAIVMGPGLLGWEMILTRRPGMALAEMTQLICEAVAAALQSLGAAAAFRPRNDIEVAGRKVCGTGGYFDQDTLVFQGTVLIALDLALMTQALKLPAHKLGRRGLASFAERVTDLATCLGEAPQLARLEQAMADHLGSALALSPHWQPLTPDEEAQAQELHDTLLGLDDFVGGHGVMLPAPGRLLEARRVTPGGEIALALRLRDGEDGVIEQAMISGDMLVTPARILADLEAHLRQTKLAGSAGRVEAFLHRHEFAMLGAAGDDVVALFVELEAAA